MEATAPRASQAGGKSALSLITGLLGMIGVPAALFSLGGEESDPSTGFVIAITVVGLALGVTAITLGAIARSNRAGSRGVALAGIITGILGAAFVAFLGIFVATGGKLY